MAEKKKKPAKKKPAKKSPARKKAATKARKRAAKRQRTFLCVIDDSDEVCQALGFACRRAVNSGARIALIYVIEPIEFQHWVAVGERMQHEAREEAEETLKIVSAAVENRTGHAPVVYIREGEPYEELLKLIEDEKDISLLVLGASPSVEGPGPLLARIMKDVGGRLRVPVTVVPGGLTIEQINDIT